MTNYPTAYPRPQLSGVRGRDGVSAGSGTVFLSGDSYAGILPYTTTAALSPAPAGSELFNTALLSGKAVAVPLVVHGLTRQGKLVDLTGKPSVTCSPTDDTVLGVSGCTAILDGTESGNGAAGIVVALAGVTQRQTVLFRVHTLVAESFELSAPRTTLRPIANAYDTSDASCRTMVMTEVNVYGSATFTDGVDEFPFYDVSSMMRLGISDSAVAALRKTAAAWTAKGKTSGGVTLSVNNYSQATLDLNVTHPTDLAMHAVVLGLDYVVFDSLDGLVLSPGGPTYARATAVAATLADTAPPVLRLEGQSAHVSVSAVLSDASGESWSMPLSKADGLVLTSVARSSVHIDNATHQRVFLPADPAMDEGELAVATWEPANNNKCGPRVVSQQPIELNVRPLVPTLLVNSPVTRLVPVGDVAALPGSDFPTQAQLSVDAQYAADGIDLTKSISDDARVVYASTNTSLFTVDDAGKVTANDQGLIGEADVVVTFRGQKARFTITIAKFKDLRVSATAGPAYTNSGTIEVTELRRYECTEPITYQEAMLVTTIVLTNNDTKIIPRIACHTMVTVGATGSSKTSAALRWPTP